MSAHLTESTDLLRLESLLPLLSWAHSKLALLLRYTGLLITTGTVGAAQVEEMHTDYRLA